jgi:hypothetical protein
MTTLVRRLSAVVFVLRGARGHGGAQGPVGQVRPQWESATSAGDPRVHRHRLRRTVIVGVLTLCAATAVSAAPASASFTYPFIRQLSPFTFPLSSAVDQSTGHALVADNSLDTIEVFDSSGNHMASWNGSAATNPPGTPAGSFGSGDVSVASNDTTGDVYVTDDTHNVVDILNSSGGYIGQITATPSGPLGGVLGIAVDQTTGDVYVSDYGSGVIDVFNSSGGYLSQISSSGTPVSFALIANLAVDPGSGHLFLADLGANRVYEFTTAGSYVTTMTGSNTPSGSFGCPTFTGVGSRDSDGHVFVVSGGCGATNAVDEFDGSGAYIAQITGTPSGAFQGPTAVSIDQATGDEYVSDVQSASVVDVFGPGVLLPDVTTGQPTNVQQTSATLNGTVNPDGSQVTDCHFEYGTTTSYGQSAPCVETVGSVNTPVQVHADLSGLMTSWTYHVRLVASNSNGTVDGRDQSLDTPGPPTVDLEGTDQLGQTGARLLAKLNPHGSDTTYHFEYGTTTAYGQSTPEGASVGSDFSDHAASTSLSGLAPDTAYHFRVVATNSAGTTDGPDQTFTTAPPALIDVQPPTGMTDSSGMSTGAATLHVFINPLGSDTSYHFEYGTTAAYGASTPSQDAGAGNAPVLGSAGVTGLQTGTTYHYRTVASNAYGTYDGPDSTFTTPLASCPNTQSRTGASASLPDCRAYEQVSPENKGGYFVSGAVLAPDGGRVEFVSQGVFAGSADDLLQPAYVAQRTANGWVTAGVDPPAGLGRLVGPSGVSGDLSKVRWDVAWGGPTTTDINLMPNTAWFLRRPDGSFVQDSPTFQRADQPGAGVGQVSAKLATADLSHVFTEYGGHAGTLLPSAPLGIESLYEVDGGTIRLASLDPSGNPVDEVCGPFDYPPNGISADGSKMFFTEGCNGPIYARIDGSSTVDLSNPSPNDECTTSACLGAPAGPARFAGQSNDGSKVFLLSPQQLTDDASEDPAPAYDFSDRLGCLGTAGSGCNLYEYDFSRPTGHNVVDVSAGDTSGLGPQVRGVVRVADNGSAVYFVAGGVLSSQPNALGQSAQPGADNLYRYDTNTGAVAFIAGLCSGPSASGSVGKVTQCAGAPAAQNPAPGFAGAGGDVDFSNGLTTAYVGGGASQSDVSPDGRFLVFSTYAQLTPDDTNQAQDVYEYDSQTGGLWRVSVGHDGQDQNGNGVAGSLSAFCGLFPCQGATAARSTDVEGGLVGPDQRVLSDDGQTVVFKTARPLATAATDGALNVYEWHQGQVTLLSGGQSPNGVIDSSHWAISPSGQDIVFDTDQGLVPQDTDGLGDIYDARIGGGFPVPPATAPCQGDACQGQPSTAPALALAASVSFSGPGNATPGATTTQGKASVLTRTVRGWRFLIGVKVPDRGRITITGAGVRGVSAAVRGAGTYRIAVTLTARARAVLKHAHKLKLMMHVRYAPSAAGSASTATVHVTDTA